MSAPILSIVIPTYRRHSRVLDSLAALGGCNRIGEVEVIVVDQTDPPLEKASLPAGPIGEVRILHLAKPNVSSARNAGALAARSRLLLFLDDDMRLSKTYIETLIGILKGDTLDVVGGYNTPDTSDFSETRVDGHEIVSWLPTGNIALSKEKFLTVGGFDENIYRYSEDAEFSHRLSRNKLRLAIFHNLQATHVHIGDGGTWVETSILAKAKAVFQNGLYFFRVTNRRGLMRYVLMCIMQEVKGNGKIRGGNPVTRALAVAWVFPSAVLYALQPPRLVHSGSHVAGD